jgi:uncharacterized membrane protein YjjP (DUF1212 family)
VIFCMLKGYSSSNKTILAQFSVAICALFIIFYCEGKTSTFLILFLLLFIMIIILITLNFNKYLS